MKRGIGPVPARLAAILAAAAGLAAHVVLLRDVAGMQRAEGEQLALESQDAASGNKKQQTF